MIAGAVIALAIAACAPLFISSAPVVVTAQLYPDGSCAIYRDGTPVFSADEHPRVSVEYDRGYNVVPLSEALYSVMCQAEGYPKDPRGLLVNFGVARGQAATRGAYVVERSIFRHGPGRFAEAYLGDPYFTTGPGHGIPLLGGYGSMDVQGDSGVVVLLHIDTTTAVGRIRFIGHRNWNVE